MIEASAGAAGISLITGVPFAFLWVVAARDYDPAFTHERWAGTAAEPAKWRGWDKNTLVAVRLLADAAVWGTGATLRYVVLEVDEPGSSRMTLLLPYSLIGSSDMTILKGYPRRTR